MSGLVGVPASVLGRYSAFSESLANLRKPEGTDVKFEAGIDIGANRNAIIRQALEEERDWVMFVDDDMVFPSDLLERLLAHEQPAVASLYLNRKPPLYPMAFNATNLKDGERVWIPVSLMGAPSRGLAEIVAAGTGGMLIRAEVFKAIEYDTWFDHHQSTDDLAFCQRVIEAGFSLYLDLAARMGHISTYEVWPSYDGNWSWSGNVKLTDSQSLTVKLGD